MFIKIRNQPLRAVISFAVVLAIFLLSLGLSYLFGYAALYGTAEQNSLSNVLTAGTLIVTFIAFVSALAGSLLYFLFLIVMGLYRVINDFFNPYHPRDIDVERERLDHLRDVLGPI